MKVSLLSVLCAVALVCTVGMAVADPDKDESGKGRERHKYSSDKDKTDKKHHKEGRHGQEGRSSYFHEHGYTRLRIPPGHYPPPGECRLWYPDRPPGHQPPPGRCHPVPPGAWVIRHPQDHPGHVHVTVYEPQRPSTVLVVGEFDIASGGFIRVILAP
jgi:hypothetical protein